MTPPATPDATSAALHRRRFVRLVGGGVVVAAATPWLVTGCAAGMPDDALQPWTASTEGLEIRRGLLSHALLAPNPHNRQPWLADLRRADEILLVCDGNRLLPETDPFGRQILIGCGAFVELAVMAAAQQGRALGVALFPAGEPAANALPGGVPFARLTLGAPGSAQPDPLFAQVRERRTHKGAYDNARPVDEPQWQRLHAAAGAQRPLTTGHVATAGPLAALRDIARSAFEIETTTPAKYLESARLMRIGPEEISLHRDGIAITRAVPRFLNAVGVFDRFEVPQRGTAAHQRMLDYWKPFDTGSGFAWIATEGNRRSDQIAVGRAFVRSQLQAAADGLAVHPLSQALQEFPAMREARQAVHAALGLFSGQTLQMLSRVGYPLAPAGHAPRRALADLLWA